jgi:hypothetical protein
MHYRSRQACTARLIAVIPEDCRELIGGRRVQQRGGVAVPAVTGATIAGATVTGGLAAQSLTHSHIEGRTAAEGEPALFVIQLV